MPAKILASAVILSGIAGLTLFPEDCVSAAQTGVALCLDVIVPSLFPFFVLSALVIELGLAERLGKLLDGVMKPLFGLGGACSAALALGLVGGYPAGAKTAADLFSRGLCSRKEASRLLAFCNNSGPGFILGVVGAGIFQNPAAGLTLYLCHVTAALLIGLGLRLIAGQDKTSSAETAPLPRRRMSMSQAFTYAVTSSFAATLNVCAFVIFFTVIIRLLLISGAIPLISGAAAAVTAGVGLTQDWLARAITGFIEISSGVWTLKDIGLTPASFAMAAFILGWGGLSVHCQVKSILSESRLSSRAHTWGKLAHGIISAMLALAAARVMGFPEQAAAEAYSGLAGSAAYDPAFTFMAALSLPVCFAFVIRKLSKR